MLEKLFKKSSTTNNGNHPALQRLDQMGAHSAECTMVRNAQGKETRDEVGLVSFYRRANRLFTRDQALYLVPPSIAPDKVPFSGRGEVLNLRFQHLRTPYSLNCKVVQRVRFSERLLGGLEPRVAVGYKLNPLSNVNKNESRGSLRFAHIRGVKGPQVFPHFRFDLFVERLVFNGLAHEQPPKVIPFPGDEAVPNALQVNGQPEEMVGFFHNVLRTNPEHLRTAHISLVSRDTRTRVTELIDLGYTDVLGLAGEKKGGAQIHLRNQNMSKRKNKKEMPKVSEGDVLLLRFVSRGLLHGSDIYYRWICRVSRVGFETLTLRPRDNIQQQTGLPVVVRDFCVGGVGLQNSPILESYLMGEESVPEDPEALLDALEGKGVLLHFYPRLYFPGEVEIYQPKIPASFSLLGEIARGYVDSGKDAGRIASLGANFSHDPVDYDPQSLDVVAWEPLRGLRESQQFKEIHRALNGLMAYLENR